MNKVLLVGSGAETDLGLPAGADYTIDTFYTRKPALYEALRSFYDGRLVGPAHLSIPHAYAKHFLFNSKGEPFSKLLDNLFKTEKSKLEDYSGIDLEDLVVKDLNKEQRKSLFKLLINEDERGDDRGTLLSKMGDEAISVHYGILEPFFSSVLDPAANSGVFWKLVNFYWSAFFSILLPMYRFQSGNSRSNSKLYSVILNDLEGILETLFSDSFVDSLVGAHPGSYYALLGCAFDAVLTTNYTPFARCFSKDRDEVSYLAGKLTTFENPSSLEIVDVPKNPSFLKEGAVFPYMMGQCPVKPLISPAQLSAYADALHCLSEADMLVVLGYSFSNNDGHIISFVRDFLLRGADIRMTYLAYVNNEQSELDRTIDNLSKQLRLDRDSLLSRVNVISLGTDGHSAERAAEAVGAIDRAIAKG